MPQPKLTRLELRIMETLWSKGPSSIRELQEAFPEAGRPAYTTVQTVVYRLEFKKAVRRASKVSNAHVFRGSRLTQFRPAPHDRQTWSRSSEANRCPSCRTSSNPGRLTPEEVREAQRALRNLAKKEKE